MITEISLVVKTGKLEDYKVSIASGQVHIYSTMGGEIEHIILSIEDFNTINQCASFLSKP